MSGWTSISEFREEDHPRDEEGKWTEKGEWVGKRHSDSLLPLVKDKDGKPVYRLRLLDHDKPYKIDWVRCRQCGNVTAVADRDEFTSCSYCGNRLRWDDWPEDDELLASLEIETDEDADPDKPIKKKKESAANPKAVRAIQKQGWQFHSSQEHADLYTWTDPQGTEHRIGVSRNPGAEQWAAQDIRRCQNGSCLCSGQLWNSQVPQQARITRSIRPNDKVTWREQPGQTWYVGQIIGEMVQIYNEQGRSQQVPVGELELVAHTSSFDLDRFVQAQDPMYDQALGELQRGKKDTHWMWYMFPQYAGLGSSPNSTLYAINSPEEAEAYLEHPVLGQRLHEMVSAMLVHSDPVQVLGQIDAAKLKSSLTLFETVSSDPIYGQALDALFGGDRDEATFGLMNPIEQKWAAMIKTGATVAELAHETYEDILGYEGKGKGHKPPRADIQKMMEIRDLAEAAVNFGADYDKTKGKKWREIAGLNDREVSILRDYQNMVSRFDQNPDGGYNQAFEQMAYALAQGATSQDIRPQRAFTGTEDEAKKFLTDLLRKYETQHTPTLLNTIERALADVSRRSDESYKLWPWMVTQLKKEWKNYLYNNSHWGENSTFNPGNPKRTLDPSHYVDIVTEGGPILAELRRQNRLPRGLDINQMSFKEFEDWLMDWKRENRESEDQGEVIYEYPDGWTMQRLTTPEQLQYEGDEMGHCVGGYLNQVEAGDSIIYSLRDRKGNPHATMEITGVTPFTAAHDKPVSEWDQDTIDQLRKEHDVLSVKHLMENANVFPHFEDRDEYEHHNRLYYVEHRRDLADQFYPPYAHKRHQLTPTDVDPEAKYYNYLGIPWDKAFEVVQVQGKEDSKPKPEYQERIRKFLKHLKETQGVDFVRSESYVDHDAYGYGGYNNRLDDFLVQDTDDLESWNDLYQDNWEKYHGIGEDEYGMQLQPVYVSGFELNDIVDHAILDLISGQTEDWEQHALSVYRLAVLGGFGNDEWDRMVDQVMMTIETSKMGGTEEKDLNEAQNFVDYLRYLGDQLKWPSTPRDLPAPGQFPKLHELREMAGQQALWQQAPDVNPDKPGTLTVPGTFSAWGERAKLPGVFTNWVDTQNGKVYWVYNVTPDEVQVEQLKWDDSTEHGDTAAGYTRAGGKYFVDLPMWMDWVERGKIVSEENYQGQLKEPPRQLFGAWDTPDFKPGDSVYDIRTPRRRLEIRGPVEGPAGQKLDGVNDYWIVDGDRVVPTNRLRHWGEPEQLHMAAWEEKQPTDFKRGDVVVLPGTESGWAGLLEEVWQDGFEEPRSQFADILWMNPTLYQELWESGERDKAVGQATRREIRVPLEGAQLYDRPGSPGNQNRMFYAAWGDEPVEETGSLFMQDVDEDNAVWTSPTTGTTLVNTNKTGREYGQDIYLVQSPYEGEIGRLEAYVAFNYHDEPEDFVVYDINAATEEATEFFKEMFSSVTAEWDKSKTWDWSDYEYGVSDWRDTDNVSDGEDLIRMMDEMGNYTYDNWQYEWDDSDVDWELGDPDEYGIKMWNATIMEPMPTRVGFGPDDWMEIFNEELQNLTKGYADQHSWQLAKALVEVPKFILEEDAQKFDIEDRGQLGTPSHEEWTNVGGMNFIDSAVAQAMHEYAEFPEVLEWLHAIAQLPPETLPDQGKLFDWSTTVPYQNLTIPETFSSRKKKLSPGDNVGFLPDPNVRFTLIEEQNGDEPGWWTAQREDGTRVHLHEDAISPTDQLQMFGAWGEQQYEPEVPQMKMDIQNELEYEDGEEFYVKFPEGLMEWWDSYQANPAQFNQENKVDWESLNYYNPNLMTLVERGPSWITVDWENLVLDLANEVQEMDAGGRGYHYNTSTSRTDEWMDALVTLYKLQEQLDPAKLPDWEKLKELTNEKIGENFQELTEYNFDWLFEGMYEWWKSYKWPEIEEELYGDEGAEEIEMWEQFEEWRENNEEEYYKEYVEMEKYLFDEHMGNQKWWLKEWGIDWWKPEVSGNTTTAGWVKADE